MEVEETEMETEQVEEEQQKETTTSVSITPTPLVPALPTSGGNLQIRRDYNPKGYISLTPSLPSSVLPYLFLPLFLSRTSSPSLPSLLSLSLSLSFCQ